MDNAVISLCEMTRTANVPQTPDSRTSECFITAALASPIASNGHFGPRKSKLTGLGPARHRPSAVKTGVPTVELAVRNARIVDAWPSGSVRQECAKSCREPAPERHENS